MLDFVCAYGLMYVVLVVLAVDVFEFHWQAVRCDRLYRQSCPP